LCGAPLCVGRSRAGGLAALRPAGSPPAFVTALGAAPAAARRAAPAGWLTKGGRATAETTPAATTTRSTAAEASARWPRAPRPWPSSARRPSGGPAAHRPWPSWRRRGAARRRLVHADHAAVETRPVHSADRPLRPV